MKKASLEQIVRKVRDMPSLPDTMMQIIRLTEDPDSTVQDLEEVILKDQALTSKVLQLANSTHYGYSRRISTISEATVLLGFQTIKSIALASSVNKILVKELPGYGLKKNMLWEQSQSCAIIARFIAKKLRLKNINPEEAYIAGLLRDIGKVILNYYVTNEFYQIIEIVQSGEKTFLEAEKEVLGFDHGQIGAKVAEKWNFPVDLVEAIAYHHVPQEAKNNPTLVSIVHIADTIVMMLGIDLGIDSLKYNFSKYALDTLNIDEHAIEQYISDVSDVLHDEAGFNLS